MAFNFLISKTLIVSRLYRNYTKNFTKNLTKD
jgi:hypothetical protein